MGVPIVTAEPVATLGLHLGEGPVWDDRSGTLVVVDILEGRIVGLHPDGTEQWRSRTGRMVGAVALTVDGDLLAAVQGGIARRTAGDTWEVVVPIEAGRDEVRLNDGSPDPSGRWWIGSMAVSGGPGLGRLFCVGTDGRATPVVEGVGISNGIGWVSPDTAYYVDSLAGGVDLLVVADGPAGPRLVSRRRFVDVAGPAGTGVPDGLALDDRGCVYVAVNGAGEVRRYDPDGRHDLTVTVPVAQVTSVAFGGDDLGTLFVTTAREGLTPEQVAAQPGAGDVHACRPGARGLAPQRARLAV